MPNETEVPEDEVQTVRQHLVKKRDEELKRVESDAEVEIISAVRGGAASPVTPTRLVASDSFCFSCHKGIGCWNQCCLGADITLTPYDILRLTRHLNMRAADFLAEYTVPAYWNKNGLPVAKLKMGGADGAGACSFMTDDGCSVYADRPATCRYYPLGLATVKMKGGEDQEDFFFLVKETHCEGHRETKELTVDAFRAEQGVDAYDDVNRGWMDIMMKMASWKVLGGPWGKEPSAQTKQMFFMVSTDVDALRRFVFDTKFLDSYEIDAGTVRELRKNDEALLQLGFDWMKSVMFNENTLSLKEKVLQQAMARARQETGAT